MFFETLLKLIDNKGISKNQMLKDLHLAKGSISNWENRGTVPSGETLQKIADYFGVTTDYLLTGNKKSPEKSGDSLEQVIIERSPTPLPEEQKKALLKLIDSTIDTFLEAREYEQKHKQR